MLSPSMPRVQSKPSCAVEWRVQVEPLHKPAHRAHRASGYAPRRALLYRGPELGDALAMARTLGVRGMASTIASGMKMAPRLATYSMRG